MIIEFPCFGRESQGRESLFSIQTPALVPIRR